MPTIPTEILAAARQSHAQFYPLGPFVSVTLAQWALESAWGTALSGTFNYFGIKARPGQPATIRWTHETLHGQYIKIPQPFADYNTPLDCFMAHASLLTTPHYALCTRAPNPQSYAHALLLCGYATGIPGHPYDRALIDLMDAHNLYQYDH